MAPDFRGRLGLVISFINTEQDGGTFTATTAGSFLSFRATVSIDERKQQSNNFKCFEDDGLVNFFAEGVEISSAFSYVARAKIVFQNRYGEETASVLERLSGLTLQTVSKLMFFCCCCCQENINKLRQYNFH